jgi:protein-S-isoprenylcysteine O-methyltransferase Ste14
VEQKLGGSDASKLWEGMGYVFVAVGLLFVTLVGLQLITEFLTHNLWNVWGLVIALLGGLCFHAGGRWLIKNRRPPFTPPRQHG